MERLAENLVNLFLVSAATIMEENQDVFYMRRALEQAHFALEKGEIPIGAVVVCSNNIVGVGHNMTESLNDPTAHAEMIAITAACNTLGGKYLNDCTLYVTVEPCPMCAAASAWAQIGRLVYGAADPKRGYSLYGLSEENTPEAPKSLLHPRTKTTSGILADECSSLIKVFFAEKR